MWSPARSQRTEDEPMGVGKKISRGGKGGEGATEKRPKIAKLDRKIALKPLSTICVPCMKIQGGHGPPAPDVDAHA